MASQQKDMLSQITPPQITQAVEGPMVSEGCSSATLDLAALGEGTLAQEGLQRLASHLHRCSTCRELFASLVKDVESAPRTANHDLMTGIAAVGSGQIPTPAVGTNSRE